MATLEVSSPAQYAPGERVPISGVYRVIHDEHRIVHSVCAIKGDEFPPCRKCRNRVRFRLFMESDYLSHDWDLAGPNPKLLG